MSSADPRQPRQSSDAQDEREFLRKLVRTQESERQLMACEIHDGVVQYITAALLQLESIDLARLSAAESQALLDKAAMLLRSAVADARRVLSGLRPPILDEQGITAAIPYLIEEICRPGGIEVAFSSDLPPERLDPLVEGTLFRIAQESLHNIIRHSGASRATIDLRSTSDRVRLVIRDLGRGFDLALVSDDHFGLTGIRKRAELAGGHADIQSAPGVGTTVLVELPIMLPSAHF
jgi:signal transduction histidine kinase